jgi:hypothetical protein
MIETHIHPENFGVSLAGDSETGEITARILMVQATDDQMIAVHLNEVQAQRAAFLLGCSREEMVEERERMEAASKLEVARPGMVPQGARLPR